MNSAFFFSPLKVNIGEIGEIGRLAGAFFPHVKLEGAGVGHLLPPYQFNSVT